MALNASAKKTSCRIFSQNRKFGWFHLGVGQHQLGFFQSFYFTLLNRFDQTFKKSNFKGII